MSMFGLEGPAHKFKGRGKENGEPETTSKFSLRQGVALVRINHEGHGKIKLSIVAVDGASDGGDTLVGTGGGAVAGAAVGSFIPVVGTLVGGFLGAVAGFLFSGEEGWSTGELEGLLEDEQSIIRIGQDDEAPLKPGDYRVEVRSNAKWSCEVFQPDLGQAIGTLKDGNDDDFNARLEEPGLYIFPPRSSGRRPVLATVRHTGAEGFFACAYSVDGTDFCEIHYEEGQFYAEDITTGIKPGKEYMLLIVADGPWNIEFNEGY